MDNVKELFPYVQLIMAIVTSVLAVVLTSSVKNLVGKGWLLAAVVITLVTRPGFQSISLLAQHSTYTAHQISQWYGVLALADLFGIACFGFFLFSNWIVSRMKLDVKDLLFSFSGRIPRSAFWISACILFPLGTLLGFAPFSEATGFSKMVIWTVYVGWFILSVWIALAVYTKRWHDCSKSGWMSLVLLIPVIGLFWFLGYLGFVPGTHGRNQYGDDPFAARTA